MVGRVFRGGNGGNRETEIETRTSAGCRMKMNERVRVPACTYEYKGRCALYGTYRSVRRTYIICKVHTSKERMKMAYLTTLSRTPAICM